MGWMRWLTLALLGGYLLFCHGCHGDEDDELFAALGVNQQRAVQILSGTASGDGLRPVSLD